MKALAVIAQKILAATFHSLGSLIDPGTKDPESSVLEIKVGMHPVVIKRIFITRHRKKCYGVELHCETDISRVSLKTERKCLNNTHNLALCIVLLCPWSCLSVFLEATWRSISST